MLGPALRALLALLQHLYPRLAAWVLVGISGKEMNAAVIAANQLISTLARFWPNFPLTDSSGSKLAEEPGVSPQLSVQRARVEKEKHKVGKQRRLSRLTPQAAHLLSIGCSNYGSNVEGRHWWEGKVPIKKRKVRRKL